MSWSRYFTGYSAGNTSDPAVLLLPRFFAQAAVNLPVLVLHGAGGNPTDIINTTTAPNQVALIAALVKAGFAVVAPNMDGGTWGNDTAVQRISDALTYAQGTLGLRSGRCHIIGGSMGGGAMFAWARANPTLIQSLIGLLPVSDVSDIVTNNRGGLAASVNAAYSGGWSQATYGAAHNPVTLAGSLTAPAQVWSASDDTTVVPSTVAAFASAYGGTIETHNALTGGHSDTAIGQIPASSVLAFLAAHS